MVNTNAGTLLGKCALDGQPIFDGSGFRSKFCTVYNGKWISGDALVKLYDRTFSAFLAHHNDQQEEKKLLLGKLEKYGWQTDPETGKLFKITDKTKALNRDTTMEKK
jgi:hypothetical protein|tara:strand:- start:2 stop:322 length:321 start_codon:yes stop_codon:yes gene_type:complete